MSATGLRSRPKKPPAGLKGARKAEFPTFIEPCDPSLRQRAPAGDDWVYEIKADGYRAQVHVRDGNATAYSRTGLNWTGQFSVITEAAERLAVRQAVFDGEAVVYGATGVPDFQALRRELGRKRVGGLRYHAFDLLHLDGYDLRKVPYVARKELLKTVLADAPEQLIYVGYVEAQGNRVLQHACNMGLEGVVGKRRESIYRSGRAEDWVKLKCTKSDNFPIVAFVEKLGARPRRIASLYLGRRKQGKLLYAGKARTGYSESTAREIREQLDPLIVETSPLSEPVRKPKATWVQPALDAEIEYGGLTDDGLLRAAVFKGIRDDLRTVSSPPIQPEAPPRKPHIGVPRENILQLLPDAVAPSKDELVRYWRKVGKRALHFLGGRPLKLVRHTHRTTFYHKGKLPPIPDSVHQLRISKRQGGEGVRVWVDDVEGLIGLVTMGAVELHPWAATVDDIERADRLVFDLDPGPGVAWEFVVETALHLKRILEDKGYESWPKLTGGKGLHLMAPMEPRLSHDNARAFCRSLVEQVAAVKPEAYTISPVPARRNNRIFLDYLRNGRGTTAVGAYSPRARAGFPVAAPVSWKDIERGVRPDAYTLRRPPRRA
ncbi:MAG TPA: DNA ligase D [Bradyrhizobium sp.]|nr:DNA ligase D [Bradyrhizobium sp.]